MSKENITDFINSVLAKDDGTAKTAFSAFVSAKAKTLNEGPAKKMALLESFKRQLLEYGNANPASEVSMEGDFITVNGKKVGRVQNDLNDFDSGINFVSIEGDFSREFQTAEELFAFISQKYLGASNVK